LAYGTESIPKVDKIFGPGSAFVTMAKQLVALDPEGAAVDLPAGPSEVMVVADRAADPRLVAADLLSQAEHGSDSQVMLVTTDGESMNLIADHVLHQLAELPRKDIAHQALLHSVFIAVSDMNEALSVVNSYAPEHLVLQVRDASSYIPRIQHAGSVFVGPWTPESAGDYASGTNHVLPTYGLAKAYGGLSLESFMKSITFQELSRDGVRGLASAVVTLARMEGLEAHARAMALRVAALETLGKGEGSLNGDF
jgi:histidinol dehydrogenase